ncbi:MAG: CoA transferase, partial [Hyphomicrobium sp.]|nr:CoA transferase [Hyphomicrobium sp.]
DEVRDWGPPFHDEDASYFIGINRNKRSVGLDLAQPEGGAVLLRLLEGADVLIENFKPGSMEKWGIGYEELAKKFPRLIYCKVSGFGAEGPLGGFPGYDAIVGAMAGHYSVNGSAESGPMRIGLPVVDITTGLYCVIGIMLAMHERHSSGKGQFIDAALYDSAMSLMHPHAANYFLSGKIPGLSGNTHGNLAPYGMFKTKTCNVMIGAGNNRSFKRVCEELGVPEMAEDPRFATNGDRIKNRDELNRIITERLAQVDGQEFALKLLKAGLPCGPVLNTAEALNHPHATARGTIVEAGWYKGIGTPVKLSRTPASVKAPPPKFSQHTRQVLAENGFDEASIERLIAAGVLVEKRRA